MRLQSIRGSLCLAAVAASLLLTSEVQSGTVSVWNGSPGNWDFANRWSTNPFYPDNGNGGVDYDAVIPAGIVFLNVDVTLNSFTLSGGSLNAGGSMTTGTFTLSDTGTLSTIGPIVASKMNLIGGTVKRNLTLPTTLTNTIGNVTIADGFQVTIPFGSTVTAATSSGDRQGQGPGTLVNQGTFIKSGTNRYFASMPFNNDGDVQVQQGNLRLNNNGAHTGTFNISSGAQLELTSTQTFQNTATVSGAGGLVILSGTSTIQSDVSTAFVRTAGGTLAGTGNLDAGYFSFDSGKLDRSLTLPVTASNILGNLSIGAGSTLTVPVGSTLNASATPANGFSAGSGPGAINNQGLLTKTGANAYNAGMVVNNTGQVQVQQSTLSLTGGGTHTGTFNVASGTQLQLAGTHLFQPSATISGAGNLAIIGGTSTINGDVNTPILRLAGGTLAGSGNLNVDHFVLENGKVDRNLTIPATAGNVIGAVTIGAGSTITNPVGSTLKNFAGNGGGGGGPGTLINQGTFIKDQSNSFVANMPFTNVGEVQVQAGSLRLNNINTHSGTFFVANGASLQLGGTQKLLPSATVSGPGGLAIVGDTATVDSTITTGFISLNGGTLTGSGNLQADRYLFDSGTLARDLTLPATSGHSLSYLNIADGYTLKIPSGSQMQGLDGYVTGPGRVINEGTYTSVGIQQLDNFTNTSGGVVDVQHGFLFLGGGGTQAGKFNIANGSTFLLGNLATNSTTLAPSSIISGGGQLWSWYGTLNVTGNGNNVYTGGTNLEKASRINISGSDTALGTGLVSIRINGVLSVESAGNLLPGQVLVQSGGTLAVRSDFNPQAKITAASTGTLGIDTPDFATPLNMALLGNGSMSLGSSTAGSYTATTLEPGAGNTYRLGGGRGTLTLTQPNVLTGDRPVVIMGPGTVVLAAAQDFTKGITFQNGGNLNLGGDLLGAGAVTVTGGSKIQGEGTIAGLLTIGNGATASPGYSPGTFTAAAGLALQNGSHYLWELGALSTTNPAFNWDQITLTGGSLSVSAGAVLDLAFVQSATAPNFGGTFWKSSHRWNNILNLTNGATNPTGYLDFLIDNSPWSQFGTFDTTPALNGQGVDLVWNAVPEPASWLLMLCGASALAVAGRKSRINARQARLR